MSTFGTKLPCRSTRRSNSYRRMPAFKADIAITSRWSRRAAVARPAAVLERERGAVEPELLPALVVVAADSWRRASPQ
jgi:hypothetical protein